eukprot:scaffold32492_cov33-Prasinocladus_malaysianus.AAC.1
MRDPAGQRDLRSSEDSWRRARERKRERCLLSSDDFRISVMIVRQQQPQFIMALWLIGLGCYVQSDTADPTMSRRYAARRRSVTALPPLLLVTALLSFAVKGSEARPWWWPFGGGSQQKSDGSTRCPPANFDALSDLDLEAYVSEPWYIYKQMVNSYQPIESLFCVAALYTSIDATTVKVRNYANSGAVNGPPMGTSGAANSTFELQASQLWPLLVSAVSQASNFCIIA